jgi:hypothetical protein
MDIAFPAIIVTSQNLQPILEAINLFHLFLVYLDRVSLDFGVF